MMRCGTKGDEWRITTTCNEILFSRDGKNICNGSAHGYSLRFCDAIVVDIVSKVPGKIVMLFYPMPFCISNARQRNVDCSTCTCPTPLPPSCLTRHKLLFHVRASLILARLKLAGLLALPLSQCLLD